VNKSGHPLSGLTPQVSGELLRLLRERFSITTAEELVSATLVDGTSFRAALPVDESTWDRVVRDATSVIGQDMLEMLRAPVRTRFGTGAVRTKRAPLPPDAEKHQG
jgi:hypothetical protein